MTAFAVLLAAACAQADSGAPEAEREQLGRREVLFLAALSAGNADALAELFADSAVVHVANMPPIEGRAAIRGFYENLFGYLTTSAGTSLTAHISEGGDMAYTTGTAANTFRGPEGDVTYSGKYALVWRKMGGDWVVVLYSVSSDEPADGR